MNTHYHQCDSTTFTPSRTSSGHGFNPVSVAEYKKALKHIRKLVNMYIYDVESCVTERGKPYRRCKIVLNAEKYLKDNGYDK